MMFDEAEIVPGVKYKWGDWRQYAVHSDTEVKGFFGQYRWLSNFHPAEVEYEGLLYPSTENAYQASKIVIEERSILQKCAPHEAKKIWKNLTKLDKNTEEWDARKLTAMRWVTLSKYRSHDYLMQKLLATKEKYLEERNHWCDTYWGVDIKKGGDNQLGKLLMQLRNHWLNLS